MGLERGSSALRGNVDVMISVAKNQGGVVTVKNSKQKNQEPFEPIRLRLKQVKLGVDARTRQPTTSCVLVAAGTVLPPTSARQSEPAPSLGKGEERALKALASFREVGAASGEWHKAIKTTFGVDVPGRTFNNWRKGLLAKGLVEDIPEQPAHVLPGHRKGTCHGRWHAKWHAVAHANVPCHATPL